MTLDLKYQPRRIGDFAGITDVKTIMNRFVQKPYETAFLLHGSSGLGKTSMAFAVGHAINAEITHVPSRQCNLESVENMARQFQYVPMFGAGWRVCIIDEADRMTAPAQDSFLSLLDGTATPPKTIFFFTSNTTDTLEPRFVSRCCEIEFNARKELDAAVKHLARIWRRESKRPVPDLKQLLLEKDGNIRSALKSIELELIAPGTAILDSSPTTSTKKGARNSSAAPMKRQPKAGKLIYTIGYEQLKVKRLKEIIAGLGISIIIDCRTTPYSRVPGFSMAALTTAFGNQYRWKGDILGGRQKGVNPEGISWLLKFLKEGTPLSAKPLLLCLEEAPGDCHRHHRIAIPLLEKGIDPIHILDSSKELFFASELQRAIDEDDDYQFTMLEV